MTSRISIPPVSTRTLVWERTIRLHSIAVLMSAPNIGGSGSNTCEITFDDGNTLDKITNLRYGQFIYMPNGELPFTYQVNMDVKKIFFDNNTSSAGARVYNFLLLWNYK